MGATSVVYRARHTKTGARVALKALRLVVQRQLASFRREVHVLSRLRHPGIVQILDHGVEKGVPWYSMDLIDGRTLARVLRCHEDRSVGPEEVASRGAAVTTQELPDARPDGRKRAEPFPSPETPQRRMSLDESIRVVGAICRALAFLHDNGVVHRDVKPENVVLRADGTPVLVDFGIVALFGGEAGRESPEFAEASAGTLAYMAPEQRYGRFVDARADLFSLGCVLYECVTGRLPFGALGLHALLSAPPPLPSAIDPTLPPELDELVMRLLSRTPQDRFGYADDVQQALTKIAAHASPTSKLPRATYLYRAELTGRDAALRQLEAAIDDALGGKPLCAVVSGESGVGKTRLVMELAARAAERGMAIITGAPAAVGDPGAAALGAPLHPLHGLFSAVGDACATSGEGRARPPLIERAEALGAYVPVLASALGSSPAPSVDSTETLARARARLFALLRDVLVDFAGERPFLLVLDDLQWADDLTLEFLLSLNLSDVVAPFAVVGTFRAEETSKRLQGLASTEGVLHVLLDRFDRHAVEGMVGGMLAMPSPPADLIDFVQRETSGNAYFVSEYLRAAISAGLLDRDANGRWRLSRTGGRDRDLQEQITLPPSIAELIARRVGNLDATASRALDAAAVLGRCFDFDLVARAAQLDQEGVLDAYRTLRQRHIIEEDTNGGTRFVHDRLRETVYAKISATSLVEWHERAASAIESLRADRLDAELGALGYHHAKAGAPLRAATYFERAGEQARNKFANEDAIRFFLLGVAQLGDPGVMAPPADQRAAPWGRLQEAIGDLELLAGSPAAASTSFERAHDAALVDDMPTRARRRRKTAQTMERQHEHKHALTMYEEAQGELGPEPAEDEVAHDWWREWVQIQVDRAWCLYFLADLAALANLVEQTRERVERHASPGQRARFFQVRAQYAVRRDEYRVSEETLAHTEASLVAAVECGDLQEIATARFSHAFMLVLADRAEEAAPLFAQAVESAKRMGDAPMETRFQSYFGLVHRRLGHVEETEAIAERALALAQKTEMNDYVGVAESHLAWVALRRRDMTGTVAHAVAALNAWEHLFEKRKYVYPLQWLARVPLAEALALRGATDEALVQWASLVGKPQHHLPDALADEITKAVAARDARDVETCRSAAERLPVIARALSYH